MRKNLIDSITIDNHLLSDPNEIRIGIRSQMESNFKQLDLPNIFLPHNAFKSFSPSSVQMLEAIPSDSEIKDAAWSCDSDKASGYDGFNMFFIKKMWSSIGPDII